MTKILTIRERYRRDAVPALRERFGYTNLLAVPRLTKVVVNAGVGRASRDAKELDAVVKTVERITGQKPILTKARKSIAAFKIREGMPIGVAVTLRGKRMEHFLEKLVHAALPRVRDFQGLSPKGFGRSGHYTIGLREHLVFPEISSDSIQSVHGLAITIVTTAKTAAEGELLLRSMGFPIRAAS